MKQNHTETQTIPARTTFKFTDREVQDAFIHYLENIHGVEVPKGQRFVTLGIVHVIEPRTCTESDCRNETTKPHGLCNRCAAETKAENES